MKIVNRFVDRPLPIFLMAGVAVFIGLWCAYELPINRTPAVEIPYALVVVPYAGASAEDIESEITIELEEELDTLDDLRHARSVSNDGVSTHFLEFEDRTDMTESLRTVRDKVDRAEVDLPQDADKPVIEELSFDDLPIIFFTLTGSTDMLRLREIAEEISPQLENVPGVNRVDIFGGFEREVRVVADPALVAYHDLTLDDVAAAIQRHGRSIPAGQIRGSRAQRLIRATGEFDRIDEIRSVVLARRPSGTVRVRDVATVELTHERVISGAWWNGEPSVTLIVRRRAEVNTLATVEQLKARVAAIAPTLPPGVSIEASSDSSREIRTMIRQLGSSAVFGMMLVVGVLFLVFGASRALIVASVLPFSLLFTFIGLRVLDMEISNIALFSLILVLGLVVDGAIIVGEAIYREQEAGLNPKAAAKQGIAQVGIPVISADLTTIAAFLPMLLMIGVMGQFMSVMPKVVIFALIGSIFVDHFLLPAVAARMKSRGGNDGEARSSGKVGLALPVIRKVYSRVLDRALKRRWTVVIVSASSLAVAILVFLSGAVTTVFLPKVDQARFTVSYALDLGSSLEETNRVGALISREVAALPEVKRYVLTTGDTGALASDNREGRRVGPEYGKVSVELLDSWERERSQADLVRELRGRIAHYAGVEISVEEIGEGPSVGAPLAVRVQARDRSLEDLQTIALEVERRVAALEHARDVRVDYDRGKPEVHVELDRARAAAEFDISPEQVSRALHAAFQGLEIGRIWIRDERVDVRLQAPERYAEVIENVREIPLRARGAGTIPLGEVATVHLAFGENAIFRYDAMRTITVRSDVASGESSVALEAAARAAFADLAVPPDVQLAFGGETEERDRSNQSLFGALRWGLLLIYVIIAIQFDSLRQPFIVLMTIPLSLIGVTAGLVLTGTPFSFVVFIGIVSLTGIVVNDGIVMIDAINRRRRAGMPIGEAIRAAGPERLRPVVLTTITTISGLLPLTLNIARGGEFWVPLGVAIISGLLVASLLTLIVVPVLYALIEGRPAKPVRERVRDKLPAAAPELATPTVS